MARAIALLGVGALAGWALVALFSGGATTSSEREPPDVARGAQSSAVAQNAERSAVAGAEVLRPAVDLASIVAGDARLATIRLAFYERAAAATDSAALEPLIEAAAARPDSIDRELELEALLARGAELDFAHSARMGETFFLDTRLLAPVYRDWAIVDTERALDALAGIRAPERQQALALAVLDGLGDNAANRERVTLVLPEHARFGFEYEAFVERVARHPESAIAELGRFGRNQRTFRAGAAEAWARVDPLAALAYSASIEDEFAREEFVTRIYEVWAAAAPEEVIAHLTTPANAGQLTRPVISRAVAGAAPRQLLELADTLPSGASYDLKFEAVNVLAGRDVLEALAYIDGQSSAGVRTGLLIAVADDYGQQNPSAALAWAESLSPPVPQARDAVIQAFAESDPDSALDLALAEIARDTRGGGGSLPTFMTRMITSEDSGDAARLMSRLLDAENTRSPFGQALSLWTRTDPEAAATWALANLDRLDEATFARIATDFAQRSPADAERVLASLPPERRGDWLAGIVSAIGRSNPDEALAFVERYRGQPGYAEGFSPALRRVAMADPRRAVRFLADAGQVPAGETLVTIAGGLVQVDPEQAAAWAVGLADDEQRIRAVRAVAMSWTQLEAGAREWALGLPRGEMRDAALDVLLFSGSASQAATGTLNPALLEAYSSDAARQRGVSRAAVMIGRGSAEAARLLVDGYVTDADIRRQTEDLLAQPGAQSRILAELFGVEEVR